MTNGDGRRRAVWPEPGLGVRHQFMTEATTNGTVRKAYDNNGLKDAPIRTE